MKKHYALPNVLVFGLLSCRKGKSFIHFILAATLALFSVAAHSQTTIGGVNMGNLTDYLFFFANGSKDANWQGATKGFAGDVAVNGQVAKERTSGGVPFAGTIYTNASSLEGWAKIEEQNTPNKVTPAQAFAVTNQTSRIAGLEADLANAFSQINALTATTGFASASSKDLRGLNTKNGQAQTFVINIVKDLESSEKIEITGDAGDVFILRWDEDGNPNNGYQGSVKFKSGGGIVPLGELTPANFIHVAGNINSSGGGSTPPAPYPQGPRANNGKGSLITNASDFSGGGFFTGYWLTTGDASGQTSSLSNGIFVGGWYTTTTKFSMTSGTSGVYVAPAPTLPPTTSCIGEAANYVLLGLNGGNVTINSGTNVIGNVGYSAGVTSSTNQKVGDDGQFNGTVYVHSNVAQFQYSAQNFLPTGGIVTNNASQSARLDQANASAVAASASFAAFTPNVVFGALGDNDSRTINRVGNVTVVQIGSLDFKEDQLTLVGQAGQNDAFIINVLGNFEFSGSTISLQNVSPNMVVFNFPNPSSIMINKASSVFNGTILAPTGSVEYHNPAVFNGGIIAKNISVHSDFNITAKPLQVPCATSVCDNVVMGGVIGFGADCNNTFVYCSADGDAPLIRDCQSPIGGSGDFEVMWLKSTSSCLPPTTTAADIAAGLDPHWRVIPGETGLSLNPGIVSQNTCYLRCVRRVGCTTFIESNIISLNVEGCNNRPDCDLDITISAGFTTITVSGLDGAPVTSVQVFDPRQNYKEIFNCFGDCGGPELIIPVSEGVYFVRVKFYTAPPSSFICQKEQTVFTMASLQGIFEENLMFTAAKQEDFTTLYWIHNGGFHVERYVLERSEDGSQFTQLGEKISTGEIDHERYVEYDFLPATGDNFYRLKLVNTDGSESFSEVVKINFPDLVNFTIFPNPASDFTSLNLETVIGKKDVEITIFNNFGHQVKHLSLPEVWSKYYQMDIRDLKEGHYIVWMNIPGKRPIARTLFVGKL